MTGPLRLPSPSARLISTRIDRSLIRWAAQSALISLHGMPQTFSV